MSAPPLPDIFGNYLLGDFVEVVSPSAVSWLPQTGGWLWLGIFILAFFLRYSWRRLQRWYHNRYRREAAARLQHLAGSEDLLFELNRLLKIAAMTAFSRERVASLSGVKWVEFLNNQCAVPPFSVAQRELLAMGIYTGADLDDRARQALLASCLDWVLEHENTTYV